MILLHYAGRVSSYHLALTSPTPAWVRVRIREYVLSNPSWTDCQARLDFVHSLAGYWFCKYLMGLFIVTNIT